MTDPAGSRCRAVSLFAKHVDALDDDIFHRNVAFELCVGAGSDVADFIDDFHAFDHRAEYRISPAGWPRVQVQIVDEIDVKL